MAACRAFVCELYLVKNKKKFLLLLRGASRHKKNNHKHHKTSRTAVIFSVDLQEALSVRFNTGYCFHMRITFLISTVVYKLRGEGGRGLGSITKEK